ncbi:MAG: rhomboid family intramembrane serine protease [Pirellulales bacterium]
MGIYDRDYNREPYGDSDRMGFRIAGPVTLTTKLVLLMCGVYGVQLLTEPARPAFRGDEGWLTNTFALHADLFRRPWLAFELVTYAFLHDVDDIKHILFNGFALWMFGRTVEQRYGQKEFLTFFLAAAAFAGLVWILGEWVANRQLLPIAMLGASGGIAAVLLVFCFNFPRQVLYIWGVLPLPAWAFAVLFVGQDLLFAVERSPDDHVAYTAHLGGAIFAGLYFKSRIRLSRWLPDRLRLPWLGPRPKLRVHQAEDDQDDRTDDRVVDDILRKIQERGQDSLTPSERRILEEASREYQKKRR